VDEKLKQEYMDELLVMSKLQHPNIVTLIGANMVPPNLCMVMELCECSLFNLLHQYSDALTQKNIVKMLVGVASAMHYLHTRKPTIIHRDLKSHNLLIATDGEVKLCDFGLVSIKCTTAGTPAYMAPELLSNEIFSKKVDMYAFGILMWECFARAIPFEGFSPYDIKCCICDGQERPNIPTDIPKLCQELIEQAWAQAASARPEFIDVLCDLKALYKTMPDDERSEVALLESDFGGDCLDSLTMTLGSPKRFK